MLYIVVRCDIILIGEVLNMRLSVKKSKNHIFYYALESYREGDQVKTRTYEKIGKHEDLLKICDDPYEYAKKRVEEINASLKDNKLTVNKEIDFSLKLEGNDLLSKKTSLNVGWLYLNKIVQELDLKNYFSSIEGKFKYNLPNISLYTLYSRILKPASKLSDYRNKENYYGSIDYSLQDVYKVLKVIASNSEGMQKHLFNKCKDIVELNTDVLYYDCTNFYIESEEEDVDVLNEDGDIIQWGLRKYGYSKEHRPNPIVQMGLFTDKNGIPISYAIAPGNTNEQITAIPLEKRMIAEYNHSRFIYCSDGGLGSFENRFYNTLQNRDYVVTQSLKKTPSDEEKCMFKDLNWKFVDNDEPVSLEKIKRICDKLIANEEISDEEKALLDRDMIYKDYPIEREFDPSKIAGLKIKNKIRFEERLYITFSVKYYFYQKKIFTRQLLKATNWVEKGIEKRKNPNDVSRLIKSISSTKNGEIATNKEVSINKDEVEKECKYHGFYAVATSLDTNIKELLRINGSRWRIEYQFRIMKSEFDTRPIHVSTPDGIRGHFAICYAALVVYSILEQKMKKIDERFTTSSIIATLRNMEVVKQDESYYQAIYTNSKILEALEGLYKLGLNHKYLREKTLKKAL